MTDHKELIRSARVHIDGFNGKNDLRVGSNMLASILIDVTDALESAQAQTQEAVERATAAAYGAAAQHSKDYLNNFDNLTEIYTSIAALTPASARDWLAQHDREIVERCAKIGYRVCAETRHVTLGDKVYDTIRAGGEQ